MRSIINVHRLSRGMEMGETGILSWIGGARYKIKLEWGTKGIKINPFYNYFFSFCE